MRSSSACRRCSAGSAATVPSGVVSVMPHACSDVQAVALLEAAISARGAAEPPTTMRAQRGGPSVRALRRASQDAEPDRRHAGGDVTRSSASGRAGSSASRCGPGKTSFAPTSDRGVRQAPRVRVEHRHDGQIVSARTPSVSALHGAERVQHERAVASRRRPSGCPSCPTCSTWRPRRVVAPSSGTPRLRRACDERPRSRGASRCDAFAVMTITCSNGARRASSRRAGQASSTTAADRRRVGDVSELGRVEAEVERVVTAPSREPK